MSSNEQLFTDGAAYDRLMGRWSRRVGDIFIDWLRVPKHLRWLDIGCGTGVFTEQVIRSCSPVAIVGVDPSVEQLAYARGRDGLGAVEFLVGDARDLPFPEGSFDVAVMALVIHFVPDPGKAAAEIARVVRPGGIAAAYVWDYTKAGAPTAPLAGAMRAIGVPAPGPPSPQATSREALEELWRTAGLVEIVTRAVDIPIEFADFEEFWQSTAIPVGPAGKAIAALPPDDRARLRSTLEQRVPRTADGRVVYEARASAVQGRRSA